MSSGALITTIQIDSLTIHDSSDADGNYALREAPGGFFSSPVPRVEIADKTDDDGGEDVTQWYEPRVFTIPGKIRATGANALITKLDNLAEAFALGALHTLTWTLEDGTSRQCSVRVDTDLVVSMGVDASRAYYDVQLVAPDPLIVNATPSSVTLDPFADIISGFGFPITFPLFLGGESEASTTVTNLGTRAARPAYTFQGPWENPGVANLTTGLRFYTTDLSIDDGETAVVDTAARTFTYRGVDAPELVDWTRTDWPLLSTGGNLIRALGTPETDALLVIDYRDTFI